MCGVNAIRRILAVAARVICDPCGYGHHYACVGHCDCCNGYTPRMEVTQ